MACRLLPAEIVILRSYCMGRHLLLWFFSFRGQSVQPALELFRLHGGGVISAHGDIQDLEAQADISQLLMQMHCRLCMGHRRGVFTPELSGHFERGLGQFGQLLSALLQHGGQADGLNDLAQLRIVSRFHRKHLPVFLSLISMRASSSKPLSAMINLSTLMRKLTFPSRAASSCMIGRRALYAVGSG
uniref:Uncharacterized protein n=1 Tax=Myoviridae sp. ctQ6D10 TaxID=2827288 RepID=A0A8S5R5L8_9CAUD|nr:MAG TPA: hypothetical protein [Myoviridae sp. ctQ6D10]